MPIYRSFKKETYIQEVTNFLLTNFTENLYSTKIILPNGYLCSYLQKTIINQVGTTILPKIIPVNDISTEKEEVFKIPSQEIGKITNLEEKMILAEIINSYDALGYNLSQSLVLAPSLAKLFFELEINDIDFTLLKELPIIEQAEHWHTIYNFLEFSYSNWQQKIACLKKLSSANHQKLMFSLELDRIKNGNDFVNNHIVIAGVIGNNKIIKDFIAEISKLENGHVILPPLPSEFVNNWHKEEHLQPEDPLYNISKLLMLITELLGGTADSSNLANIALPLVSLTNEEKYSEETGTVLDNLLIKTSNDCTNNSFYEDNIEYSEFNNIFLEGEYVASKCRDLLLANPNAAIAILITDRSTKDYFISKLIKYNLNFSDQIGQNILALHTTTFILEVAKSICQNFSIKNFLNLILHPIIISDQTRNLKKIIAKENRFAENIADIVLIIKQNYNSDDAENLIEICNFINQGIQKCNFSIILKKVLTISEQIWSKFGANNYSQDVLKTLAEIVKNNWKIRLVNVEDFPIILKELLSGGVINAPDPDANITICSANDSTLMNYDLLIYTNFIENTYPLAQVKNPWLNQQIINKLDIDSWAARFGNSMYDFYLNLHNKNVLITRSIKTVSSEISLPSPFLFKLKNVLLPRLLKTRESLSIGKETSNGFEQLSLLNDCQGNDNDDGIWNFNASTLGVSSVYSEKFPRQLSATDIETLIRTPYNFYAKKILHLKTEKDIEEAPKISEFGNFFHKVAELYTKNYETNKALSKDPYQSVIGYSEQLLNQSIFPLHVKKIWQIKLEAMAKEFIEFDRSRRSKVKKVFSEVRGELELNIAGKNVKLVAVADRLEFDAENKAIIIDYKTGVVPTKKDVLSGLSPQLLIEAIILLEGDFPDLTDYSADYNPKTPIETKNLIYVKIGSAKPFVSIIEIAITKEEILTHKEGLINLLTHYITHGNYNIDQNLLNYDDYRHLARR